MAIERIPIHSKTKGSLAQDEDWWTLVVDATAGTKSVEHEWSYGDAYGKGKPNSGTKTLPLDEFLASDADKVVKEKLRDLLKKAE